MDALCLAFSFPTLPFAGQQQQQQHQQQQQQPPYQHVAGSLHHQLQQVQTLPPVSEQEAQELQAQYQKLCDDVSRLHSCTIRLQPRDNTRMLIDAHTVSISGRYQDVYLSRASLLRLNPAKFTTRVRVNRGLLLKPSGEMNPGMKVKIDDLMTQTHTEIKLLTDYSTDVKPLPGMPEELTALEITGMRESVGVARLRILTIFDEMSGLHVDQVDIEPKVIPMVAGRKGVDLHYIMRTTGTNIYLPSPFNVHQYLLAHTPTGWERIMPERSGVITITGEHADSVQQAKDMILASSRSKVMQSAQIAIMTKKIDWMLTQRKTYLLRFMSDNATFIAFPPIGSANTLVTVYGDNPIYIQRTLRALARLSCDFYVASIRIIQPTAGAFRPNPMSPTLYETPKIPSISQMSTLLGQIAETSEAEVVFNSPVFEIYGTDSAVAEAYQRISTLDFVKRSNRDTRFRIELGAEHREFISGKKNGKINKVIKQTGVKIAFEEWNEYNMIIDLSTPFFDKGLESFAMLKDELPAEISFHVPEAFHKRIIGVQGRNIQRIMKKYGVFVKFSNVDDHTMLGGYFDNDDNVIARTPAKNSHNLIELKRAVLELVNPKENEVINFLTSIPLRYHRVIESSVPAIETAAVVKIRLPRRELGSDEVMITGYEPNVKLALNLLADCMPEAYEMRVPSSEQFRKTVFTVAFKSLVDKIKADFDLDLWAQEQPQVAPRPPEMVFTFKGPRKAAKFLVEAKDILVNYLVTRKIFAVEQQAEAQLRRVDSIPGSTPEPPFDTFKHFNSKLLAASTTAVDTPAVQGTYSSYSLFDQTTSAFGKSRLTGSAPNLRAIFDGNAYQPTVTAREILHTDADVHISPTTAAELPFLRPDKWSTLSLPHKPHLAAAGAGGLESPAVTPGSPVSVLTHAPSAPSPVIGGGGGGNAAGAPTAVAGSPPPAVAKPVEFKLNLGVNIVPDTLRPFSAVGGSGGGNAGGASSDPFDDTNKGKSKARAPGLRGAEYFTPVEPAASSSAKPEAIEPPQQLHLRRESVQHDAAASTSTAASPPAGSPGPNAILTPDTLERISSLPDKSNFAQTRMLFEVLNLTKYLQAFVDQEVDFDVLITLTDADLKELGVSAFGARRKLLSAIEELQSVPRRKSGTEEQQQQQQKQRK
ncbi:hypothetical protein RI367_002350 [Sorochytrium milnesiophthora]